jgi:exonuclease SbcC
VRPISLEIQGLTSYKQPVTLDFTELDLFAITGPTGSGKSSLVDAITYALFGQAPRVGRGIKDLISQGSDRVRVSLEFSAEGRRYRVHRSSARKGQSPIQLERFDDSEDEWKPIADKASDVTAEIERLLRLDYEAFIRSVLLPQGEFQEFLAGDRDQRRKVLDRLLRLGVYAAMQQRANAMVAQERAEADRIRSRLEKELGDATPETLVAAETEQQGLECEATELTTKREALEAAVRSAEQLATGSARSLEAREGSAKAEKSLAEARELLATGEKAIADLDTRLKDLREQSAKNEYDGDLHIKLTGALADAGERDGVDRRIAALAVDAGKAREDLERIQAAAADAAKRMSVAATAASNASDAYEAVRKANAAVLLRSNLRAGDPCPVCGQAVGDLPAGKHGDLDRARIEMENARSEEKKAEKAVSEVERQAAVLAERGGKLESQLAELKEDREQRVARLKEAIGDAEAPVEELKARVSVLETARQIADELRRQDREIAGERQAQAEGLAAARAGVATLANEAANHKRELEAAEKMCTTARKEIAELAVNHNWEPVTEALAAGRDVGNLVRQDLRLVQAREVAVNQEIGACRTRIDQIRQNIALAEELREKEKNHSESARVARDLVAILRADGLPAFVRDSAMQTLAAGGSGWLRKLSVGRYDLKVDGQDFGVADLWNAAEERPVQTLSGGETFLASLSLALALAEQLPGMSSDGDEGTLESLFIDEGFSNLDEETLKVVADALEVLGADRRRLIGVITHVQALAERLPARVVVHKDSAGGPSTITVE